MMSGRPIGGKDLVSDFWSTSDFVYMCLRDRRRTLAFRDALHAVVRPGDRVLDVGSGSGILALMAAQAGATEVLALEWDPELARRLRRTVAANGMTGCIQVVEADVFAADLPRCDVVVSEMIETGLVDERQVPAHNRLVETGVVDAATTVVPERYETRASLVRAAHDFYGFDLDVVRHEWPFYADDPAGHWFGVVDEERTSTFAVWQGRFGASAVDPQVRFSNVVDVRGSDTRIDALRLSGVVGLTDGLELGACPSMNGDKVLRLEVPVEASQVAVSLAYTMGAGMGGLSVTVVPA